MTLTDFLLARLAEDERVAQQASTEPPRFFPDHHTREHVARWDPARVLADCDAKRQIVELHCPVVTTALGRDPIVTDECSVCVDEVDEGGGYFAVTMKRLPCPTLRTLALPYADHPDHREEWRP